MEETPQQAADRKALEDVTADIGRAIIHLVKQVDPNLGCTIMIYDHGNGGNMAYMSSSKREDVINLLDEFKTMLLDDLGE